MNRMDSVNAPAPQSLDPQQETATSGDAVADGPAPQPSETKLSEQAQFSNLAKQQTLRKLNSPQGRPSNQPPAQFGAPPRPQGSEENPLEKLGIQSEDVVEVADRGPGDAKGQKSPEEIKQVLKARVQMTLDLEDALKPMTPLTHEQKLFHVQTHWPAQWGAKPKVTSDRAEEHPDVTSYEVNRTKAKNYQELARYLYKQAGASADRGDSKGANEIFKAADYHAQIAIDCYNHASTSRHNVMRSIAITKFAGQQLIALPEFAAENLAFAGVGKLASLAGKAVLAPGMEALGRLLSKEARLADKATKLTYEEYLAIAKCEPHNVDAALAKLTKAPTQEFRKDIVQYSRMRVMGEALQDTGKLKKLSPSEIHLLSNGGVRVEEAEKMMSALKSANPEGVALREKLLKQLPTTPAGEKLHDLLSNPIKLAQMNHPDRVKELVRMSEEAAHSDPLKLVGGKGRGLITTKQAEQLVHGADWEVHGHMRSLTPQQAIDYLTKTGRPQAAGELKSFFLEQTGHMKVVAQSGEHFKDVFTTGKLANLKDPGQITKAYNGQLGEGLAVSDNEARAMFVDRQELSPKDLKFKYHDRGPAGKTDPYIGINMGKKATRDQDVLVGAAIQEHNRVFAHHYPADPLGRLECANDWMLAVRQARSYKKAVPWGEMDEELHKQIGRINGDVSAGKVSRGAADAQIGWLKVSRVELERMEKAGLDLANPQNHVKLGEIPLPEFLPGTRDIPLRGAKPHTVGPVQWAPGKALKPRM